jgi:hypothetical protein
MVLLIRDVEGRGQGFNINKEQNRDCVYWQRGRPVTSCQQRSAGRASARAYSQSTEHPLRFEEMASHTSLLIGCPAGHTVAFKHIKRSTSSLPSNLIEASRE